MLWLFAAGVLGSICVVAIATAMNQSFESGLTAGSYALALAGVFLAILPKLNMRRGSSISLIPVYFSSALGRVPYIADKLTLIPLDKREAN